MTFVSWSHLVHSPRTTNNQLSLSEDEVQYHNFTEGPWELKDVEGNSKLYENYHEYREAKVANTNYWLKSAAKAAQSLAQTVAPITNKINDIAIKPIKQKIKKKATGKTNHIYNKQSSSKTWSET